jgi:hypothetical protein
MIGIVDIAWEAVGWAGWSGAGLLAALSVGWFVLSRRRVGNVRRAAQSAALLLLGLAVLSPSVRLPGQRDPKMLVLRDVSASVETQLEVPLALPEDLSRREVRFAGGLSASGELPDTSRTTFAPALDYAAAEVRAGRAGGVVLVTDGRFTDDWQAAAGQFAAAGAPLWIVPLDAPPRDGRVVSVAVQPNGEARDVTVTLASNAGMTRRVRVVRRSAGENEVVLLERKVRLPSDRPRSIRLTDRPPSIQANWLWEAELLPPDAVPVNDWDLGVARPEPGRVAWIAVERPATLPAGARFLSPDAVPSAGTGLRNFDAVVLLDAVGALLGEPQREWLARYVRLGGGLVLLGAGPSRTPADREDPLNRVAALVPDPFRRRPIDLVVVLDASGSMAGTNRQLTSRFYHATQACLALQDHLTDRDRLAVLVFSDRPNEVYRSDGPPNFADLADVLAAVRPSGPTRVAEAIRLAADQPIADGRTGLILVLSDLQAAPFDAERLADHLRNAGRGLAVVGIGEGPASGDLAALATRLGAALRVRDSLEDLAAVFGRLVRRHRGGRERRARFQIETAGEWTLLRDLPQPITLLLTAPTAGTDVLAWVRPGVEPLLGLRRVGLGRSATLALAEPTAVPSAVVERLISGVARPAGGGAEVRLTVEPNRLELRATLRPPWRTDRQLAVDRVLLNDPAGRVESFPTELTAPGEYRVRLPGSDGPAGLSLRDETGRVLWRDVTNAVFGAEVARLGADFQTLRRLAELTGGTLIAADRLAEVNLPHRLQPRRGHLAPVLAGLGLVFMLGDWVWRRNSPGLPQGKPRSRSGL